MRYAPLFLLALVACERPAPAASEKQPSLYAIAVWELVRREGIALKAYECPAGHRTIGIGRRDETLDSITLDEARALLAGDLQTRFDRIAKLLPDHKRHEQMAVALLAYNIGIGKLTRSDQWARILNRTDDAADMWLEYRYFKAPSGQWKESDNLRRARELEVAMWKNDADALQAYHNDLLLIAIKKYNQ
jgi:GH24 family phage-related lysozyme (muramidase)